jgi:hypothetical protein
MTSEQQGFMAKVSADFIHKNKTAEITACAFNMFILAFF